MLTPMTTSSKVNRIHSNSHKRTHCPFRVNTAPVSYIQPTKIIARLLLSNVWVQSKNEMMHEELGKITYGPIPKGILH